MIIAQSFWRKAIVTVIAAGGFVALYEVTAFDSKYVARLIARICKRAAVKAGQTLSPEEQRQLLRDLEACAEPRTCPHGRPTMIHLSIELLEKQFGRRGAR